MKKISCVLDVGVESVTGCLAQASICIACVFAKHRAQKTPLQRADARGA